MTRISDLDPLSGSPFFVDRRTYAQTEPEDAVMRSHSNPVVAFYHPKGVGNYHYGVRTVIMDRLG